MIVAAGKILLMHYNTLWKCCFLIFLRNELNLMKLTKMVYVSPSIPSSCECRSIYEELLKQIMLKLFIQFYETIFFCMNQENPLQQFGLLCANPPVYIISEKCGINAKIEIRSTSFGCQAAWACLVCGTQNLQKSKRLNLTIGLLSTICSKKIQIYCYPSSSSLIYKTIKINAFRASLCRPFISHE